MVLTDTLKYLLSLRVKGRVFRQTVVLCVSGGNLKKSEMPQAYVRVSAV